MAGYHDGALLFGKVLRERMLARQRGSADVPLSDNPFGNASFYGVYDQWQLRLKAQWEAELLYTAKQIQQTQIKDTYHKGW